MPESFAKRKLSLGFSPCPNDTFIFNALVQGRLCPDGPRFSPVELADVETLNQWALVGRLEVSKLSFSALGRVLDRYVLLMAGSALGRGCGPLLVAGKSCRIEEMSGRRIAIPGEHTTAAMLLRMYAPFPPETVAMRFDAIIPALAAGEVDAGLIIHESRFTYQGHGLSLIADLGAWWEETTGLPVPLGGIAVKRSLGPGLIKAVDRCVRASVEAALAEPAAAVPYIRQHARELDPGVIREHIALYVNEFSVDLGKEGLAAVREFMVRGRAAGIFPETEADLPLASGEI